MGGRASRENERKAMNNYLADATVIIDHLRGEEKATLFLEEFNPYISVVTLAELIQGSQNKEEQTLVLKICASFPGLTISKSISDLSIELMSKFFLSQNLSFLDALIAASALENKLVLVTDNIKHFKFIKELKAVSHGSVFKS